jgi:hypothetical protein
MATSSSNFNRDVPDYMSDIENQGIRFGYSYTDFDALLSNFNLSKLPDYDNATEPYLAYIFMSRPSLNVANPTWGSDSTANSNWTALKSHPLTAAYLNDTYGEAMMKQLTRFSKSAWLPVITTRATNYSVGDVELKTVEKGTTYYGHSIKYGKHSEDHKVSGTITIEFRNDRFLSILKMMQLWMSYIYIVSKTDTVVPQESDQMNGILDYAGSIYYLVTRRDGRELVYWEKLTGVFPIRLPFSIFSFNDSMIVSDSVSIDFSYGIKSDPNDPTVLLDIDFLSGDTYENIKTKMANGWKHSRLQNGIQVLVDEKMYNSNHEIPMVLGDIYAARPYISAQKTSSGNLKYYLLWEGV